MHPTRRVAQAIPAHGTPPWESPTKAAFADYVAEAERRGTEQYPLYSWTKATIEDPGKRRKYLNSFTVYVKGSEIYDGKVADALEADLRPLVGGELIKRLSRYDANPANNPQPPAQPRK